MWKDKVDPQIDNFIETRAALLDRSYEVSISLVHQITFKFLEMISVNEKMSSRKKCSMAID